jgi:hypothetical protein
VAPGDWVSAACPSLGELRIQVGLQS